MSEYPKISIELSKGEWSGKFVHAPKMPWGPWHLTARPKEIAVFNGVKVLECVADEYIDDEMGVASDVDSRLRHFLVGMKPDGSVLWWHNFGMGRYDSNNKRFYENFIKVENDEIIVKGYGWEVDPETEIHINIETGNKSNKPQIKS